MQVFNFSSIRAKLLLIVSLFIISISGYALFQHNSLVTLNTLENAAKSNLASEVELLTLRRHEKDFLSRKDPKYIKRFDSTIQSLRERVIKLGQTLAPYDTAITSQTTSIIETLNKYKAQFHQLSELVLSIGATKENGLRAAHDKSQDALFLSSGLFSHEDKNKILDLIQLELSYLLSPSEELSLQVNHQFNSLRQISNESNYQRALNAHALVFNKLMQSYRDLGLSEKLGARGALRSNVHQTEKMLATLHGTIGELVQQNSAKIERNLYILGAMIAFLLSITLISISTSITKRIEAITHLMEDIAKGTGDLTVRMRAKGTDELARLANSFDSFVTNLQDNIKSIANVMHLLQDSAHTSKQIAQESKENAQQQKVESESIATAINELVMTSQEITQNIEYAANNARSVKNEADKGLKFTQDASRSLTFLSEDVKQSQHMIAGLEQQSREVHSIVSTIQGIAEQTNLLALNAAIEAARAGESGRGFSVVADEVRQLSLMTNSSIQQIESTINGLTEGVQNTVALMQDSLVKADDTSTKTSQALDSIKEIATKVSEMFDLNSQIATASEEQSMVSADIDRNIVRIAELASGTHQAATQSALSIDQVNQVGNKLDGIIQQFKY